MTPAGTRLDPPWVTVIVVAHNSGAHLAQCVRALQAQSMPDFRVLVIDNASTDGCCEVASRANADDRFRFIRNSDNVGFAGANNQGTELAETPWIATVNPDAFLDPDCLAVLRKEAERWPDVAAIGGTLLSDHDPGRLDGCGDVYGFIGVPWCGGHGWPVGELPPDGYVFSPCAALALYRRDAFLEVGGFDADYFCYVEDVDLGYRLRLAGYRCRQVGAARARHVRGGSSEGKGDLVRLWGFRNSVWTFVKDTPGWLFWALLPAHVVFNGVAVARALLRGTAMPYLRGLVDAVRGVPRILRVRRRVQSQRRVASTRAARWLCWSWDAMRSRRPQRLND